MSIGLQKTGVGSGKQPQPEVSPVQTYTQFIETTGTINTSFPFNFFPTVLFSTSVDADGIYDFETRNIKLRMSTTNRSFEGEWRVNGVPVNPETYSIESKDSTDRIDFSPSFVQPLLAGDQVEFVFGPESFGSQATIYSRAQLLVSIVEVA